MAANIALRTARKNKGICGKEMATALGYKSKVSYYNIENEEVGVTLTVAEKISQILGEPIEKLFPKFFNRKVQENRTSNRVRSKMGEQKGESQCQSLG